MPGNCYCQQIIPEEWDEKIQTWDEPRFFYLVTTTMALHNPLSYNEDITRAIIEAKSKGYLVKPGGLILLKSGLFRGELFIEVQPPAADLLQRDSSCRTLQGRFYSIVTQTPISQMGKVVDRLLRDLKKRKETVRDLFLCLAVCPQCVRDKGTRNLVLANLK
jgi:hypothetical protein